MSKFLKKIIVVLLIGILLFSHFEFVKFVKPVYAVENQSNEVKMENEHYKYYYSQLSKDAKNIYDAMYEMYSLNQLKTGNANYDLVENEKISESLVKLYKNGDNALLIAFETARDAFYLDYPEVFYINMEKYSIRITIDSNNKYHVWLGTGNENSYYLYGFNSTESVSIAESQYETALNTIVNGARALNEEYNDTELIVKQIEFVHNAVVKSTKYKLDDVCKLENKGHIRTPYGALVAKEAVCEGYSKAVKVVLDKLGIPCILVRGVYKYGSQEVERHMWNYVQVDGKWYALDTTFDDSDDIDERGEERINKDYFLVGESFMSCAHYTDGIMSAPEFEFKYPDLEYDTYGVTEVANMNGLEIKYSSLPYQGDKIAVLDISYKGMNFANAKAAGYHFVTRWYYSAEKADDKWLYIDTKLNPSMIYDGSESFSLTISGLPYIEIAVVDKPIDERAYSSDLYESGYYQRFLGDESMFLASSGLLELPDATYKAPPRFESASPYIESKLKAGKTTHIKVTYDKKLKKVSSDSEIGCFITTKNAGTSSAEVNSKVSNFKWNRNRTIEFDFTPSDKYGDNSVIYYFNITGLVDEETEKVPTPPYYYVQNSFGCTYSMAQAKAWRVYGRPTLIEDGTTSIEGWKLSDGTEVSKEQALKLEGITDKLALVVNKTSAEQENKMNELLENETNSKVLSSQTYNIDLVLCNKKVLSTANNHKVTVYLGFPEGYGPEDTGVTFKTYHFKTKNGEIVGIEEIPCVVTPYGLLVTCDSFSPFEVVALKSSNLDVEEIQKSVVITAEGNGKVEGVENNILLLNKDNSKKYTIKANDGYEIDSLTMFGKIIDEVKGKTEYELTVNYSDVINGNNIIHVSFVSKEVVREEEKRGEENIVQPINNVLVSSYEVELETNKKEVQPGEIFEIRGYLSNLINIKDGLVAFAGQLEFDTSLVEIYNVDGNNSIIGEEGWNLSAFNEANFKFVADNGKYVKEDGQIFTIKFKVKDDITTEQDLIIKLNDISASEGNGVILPLNAPQETVHICIKKEEDYITSEKYIVNSDKGLITKIIPNTTVGNFKANVESNTNVVLKNKDGKELSDSDIIATGNVVKIGDDLSFTLVVIGDTDGDGKAGVNDLAQLKLHLIEKKKLDDISLISADVDETGDVSINDVAKLKLILIGNVILK